MKPVNIFISYAHADEQLMEELFEFMQPLQMSGSINIWNDKAIAVGDLWDNDIKKALVETDIVLFLISAAFLASTYINKTEIVNTMQQQKEGKTVLVPVMLKPCDLKSHIVAGEQYQISDFQGLPKGMKPVIKWEPKEDAWMNITNGLKPVINSIQKKKAQTEPHDN